MRMATSEWHTRIQEHVRGSNRTERRYERTTTDKDLAEYFALARFLDRIVIDTDEVVEAGLVEVCDHGLGGAHC